MELLNSPTLLGDPDYNKRIVNLDIETAPSFGAFFELYKEGNIVWKEKEWFVMSMAWKYLGDKKVYIASIWDFEEWDMAFCQSCSQIRMDYVEQAEEKLMGVLWDVLDKADLIVGHNSDQFDLKKLNAKFIKYRIDPPSPYKSLDTKKMNKGVANTDSNKLNDLGEFYGLGQKMETQKDLHKKCLKNDKKAQKEMEEYNKKDVILDEKLYLRLRGWAKTGPNLNLTLGSFTNCPRCGSEHIVKGGYYYMSTTTYQSYRCKNCGHRPKGELIPRPKVELK